MILTYDTTDNSNRFIDAWIDESKIVGFYIPEPIDQVKVINLFFDGAEIVVVSNKEIESFLTSKFIHYDRSN